MVCSLLKPIKRILLLDEDSEKVPANEQEEGHEGTLVLDIPGSEIEQYISVLHFKIKKIK